jgi:predicted RNA-binding Zn-ribbon protein involved in translation (DUF1610 family)
MGRTLNSTFETRRAAIWRANRLWVFSAATALTFLALVAALANVPAELAWVSALTAAVLVAITISRVVRALNSLYRCPNCGTLPYQTLSEYKCGGLGPTRANFMSPTHCPKCGTRLR